MAPYILEGNQFVVGLVELIFALVVFVLAFVLVTFFTKKRSTISGLTFLLFMSSLMIFIEDYNEGAIYQNIAKIAADFGVGSGLVIAIDIIAYPVGTLHLLFLNLLAIMNLDADVIEFFSNEIFLIVFYAILFIVGFITFKRKKREKRTYSDYDL